MSETNATAMSSTESIDDVQLIIVTVTTIAITLFVVLGGRMTGILQSTSYDSMKYRLPPKSPVGFWETLQTITSDGILWFFPRLHQRMGSDVCRINFYVPGCSYVISVADADVTREILTDTRTTKAKGLVQSFELVTDGVPQFFTSNGPRFHHARKAMAPAFAPNQIHRMERVVETRTTEWIRTRLEPMVEAGEAIDVRTEMSDLTLSIILDAAFECELTKKERDSLIECAAIAMKEFIMGNPLKLAFGVFFPSVRLARRKAKELMQISRRILQDYRQLEAPTKGTVIDLIANNPYYKNDDERAADIIDLVIAGHDTSANSLALILLELAKHPVEQVKLQNELKGLAVEDRNKSEYLKSCIKEGMRIWPLGAPWPARKVGRDFIVNNKDSMKGEKDIIIPNGSCVFMPIITLFHSDRYFPQHQRFDPSRWENPTEDMKKAFIPFSAGNRNCLGQSLANCEIQSIISRVCDKYHFEVVEEGTMKFFLALTPDGVRLKATRIVT
jgi:cytochrome P450